jgi:hypothetical protein
MWLEIAVVIALVIAFIVVLGGKDRHSEMTEEEFEAEAKRGSLLGAGVTELHKVFQPARVKQIVAERQRAKEAMNVSGDPPHDDELMINSEAENESAEDESK